MINISLAHGRLVPRERRGVNNKTMLPPHRAPTRFHRSASAALETRSACRSSDDVPTSGTAGAEATRIGGASAQLSTLRQSSSAGIQPTSRAVTVAGALADSDRRRSETWLTRSGGCSPRGTSASGRKHHRGSSPRRSPTCAFSHRRCNATRQSRLLRRSRTINQRHRR